MDKSNVIKSKSSNSAITTKSDNHSNKKSRSNSEFQRHVVKKRGVYVEKKATNISIHNTGNPQKKTGSLSPPVAIKAPPRPKPGQKGFLASVLTILSKSTAATQFPEIGASNKTKRKSEARQKKYRSKVLNDEMIKNLDQQKSLVLQYKNINNTPSNFSDTDSYKYRDVYSSKSNRSNLLKSDIVSVMSSEAKGIVKEVLEGLQSKKKDNRIQEPVTQVEKIAKSKKKGENDEQLYKFFVDLLETTFSVYNVKADYDAAPNIESGFSSKVAFEIDESVVKKLETRKVTDDDDETLKPNYYYVNDANVSGGNNNLFPEPCKKPKEMREVSRKPERPRRMKTQSFIYNTKPKNSFDANNFEPLMFSKKPTSKKTKKKTLINLFKEQLKMSYSDYEEPQTLYEALRVMARNKRKYQRAIRFDTPPTKECVFRRPKIISTTKSKNNKKYDYGYPNENMQPSKSFRLDPRKPVERDSYETLEVYGYDYEVNNNNNNPQMNTDKDMMLETLPSQDEIGFDNFEPFDSYKNTPDPIDMFKLARA